MWAQLSPRVAPAKAGAHNHKSVLLRESRPPSRKPIPPRRMGPGLRRDDTDYSRGVFSPEFCNLVCSLQLEGAGKTGRWLRPQHRVQWVAKNAHGFDRYSRDIPAFPAQWFDGLYVLSPVSGVFCHRCLRDTSRKIDATVAAPGPHDFAVRCSDFVRQQAA